MDMWGSIPSGSPPPVCYLFILTQKRKTAFIIPEIFFKLPENPAWGINFSMLLKIQLSCLKEFSPKPSTGMLSVFLCCNVSSPFVQLKQLRWAQTDITTNFPKDVDWLTLSFFVLNLPMFTTIPMSFLLYRNVHSKYHKGSFFCILIILNFSSLVFSWT